MSFQFGLFMMLGSSAICISGLLLGLYIYNKIEESKRQRLEDKKNKLIHPYGDDTV